MLKNNGLTSRRGLLVQWIVSLLTANTIGFVEFTDSDPGADQPLGVFPFTSPDPFWTGEVERFVSFLDDDQVSRALPQAMLYGMRSMVGSDLPLIPQYNHDELVNYLVVVC